MSRNLAPKTGDALLVVDVQNDFLPGGSLAVSEGDAVIPVLNRYMESFASLSLPIVLTRDWHPEKHCSFNEQGGPWPVHCVAGTDGAAFAADLRQPPDALIVDKGDSPDREAYSGFQGTTLARDLRRRGVQRVYVGGLATDYCVLETVKDALSEGFEVVVLTDAIRAVNVGPDDGSRAMAEMKERGAMELELGELQEA